MLKHSAQLSIRFCYLGLGTQSHQQWHRISRINKGVYDIATNETGTTDDLQPASVNLDVQDTLHRKAEKKSWHPNHRTEIMGNMSLI